MDENAIRTRISELVDEEHALRESVGRAEMSSDEEQVRLRTVEAALDQYWDLLRQRHARRGAGADPDEAAVRPVAEVEGYLQ